jgi:nucleoside-diphosphate-sugar epimerase
MKRVLVTGASGFIGQHCLPLLLSQGFDVHAVTSQDYPRENRRETWYRANLLDARQTETLIANVTPSHLLHLAWIATPGTYLNSTDNLRWLQASIELSRQFVERGGKRIVAAGTCAEYDWRYGFCSESLTPTAPQSLYGSSKLALNLALGALAHETGTTFGWGRIFFPYGPHEHPKRLIASVISSLLRGEPAECSAGNQVRDYVFVSDVAEAFVQLLDSDVSGAVNIASGRGTAVRDVALKIGQVLERTELVRLGALESSPSEAPLVVGDISQVKEKLDWSPKYDLDRGLRMSIEWWREQLNQGGI